MQTSSNDDKMLYSEDNNIYIRLYYVTRPKYNASLFNLLPPVAWYNISFALSGNDKWRYR